MSLGLCVRARANKDGTARLVFEVRHGLPEGWSRETPILVDGTNRVVVDRLTAEQKQQIDLRSRQLLRDLKLARAAEMTATGVERPTIEKSWERLIDLHRDHSKWRELSARSKVTYAVAHRAIIRLLGGDPELAPGVILESQIDRIIREGIPLAHPRRNAFREIRKLLNKAIREGWRTAGMTLDYRVNLPEAEIQDWDAAEVRCFASQAVTDGEWGMAKLMLTQWEIGQRLQSVRLFRYGHQYRDGSFFYRCVKNGREIRIPVLNERARAVLEAEYRHGAYMFTNKEGKPFSGPELSRLFSRLRKRIPGFNQKLQLRQLRHTVVLQLTLAGCDAPEIASITSHELATVHRTMQHYLSANAVLAERAAMKRELRRQQVASDVKGELIVDGMRCIYLGAVPKAVKPQAPQDGGRDGSR